MLQDLGGRSPVDAFVAGDVDVAPISFTDADWIGYDRQLGPSLRSDPSLSVTYYGFDTRRAPFDNALVRQAFAQAVDWRRLASSTSSARRSRRRASSRPGSPAARRATSCRPTTRRRLVSSSPRPATRTARRSARSRSSPAAAATTARSSRCSRRTWASRSTTRRWTSAPTRTGSRPTRRTCGASRGLLTTRARTTSSACCSGPAPPRTRAAGRTADFDAAIADAGAAATPRGRDRRLRPGAGDRARRGAGRARLVRHVLHPRPRRAPRRDPERPRHPPSGGARMGTAERFAARRRPGTARDARRRRRAARGAHCRAGRARGGRHVRDVDRGRRPTASRSSSRSTSPRPSRSHGSSCGSGSRTRSGRTSSTCPCRATGRHATPSATSST